MSCKRRFSEADPGKPDRLAGRDSLSRLYGVARRLARQARLAEICACSERASGIVHAEATVHDPGWDELLLVLDEELQRLPERYRSPLLLCYLEGRTQDEATKQLGWSLSTLRRRLEERPRVVVRYRMTRRGATLGVGLCAVYSWPRPGGPRYIYIGIAPGRPERGTG